MEFGIRDGDQERLTLFTKLIYGGWGVCSQGKERKVGRLFCQHLPSVEPETVDPEENG